MRVSCSQFFSQVFHLRSNCFLKIFVSLIFLSCVFRKFNLLTFVSYSSLSYRARLCGVDQWRRSRSGGEGAIALAPNKNTGARVSFRSLKVLAVCWSLLCL